MCLNRGVGGLVEVEPVVEKKKTNTYKQVFDKNNLVELWGSSRTPLMLNIKEIKDLHNKNNIVM